MSKAHVKKDREGIRPLASMCASFQTKTRLASDLRRWRVTGWASPVWTQKTKEDVARIVKAGLCQQRHGLTRSTLAIPNFISQICDKIKAL
ncbi:hypothetical protein [Asticcacaulis sp. AC460]|uniref:hypothetical protein n=1 Tax=Asticcacaulis sp. AC460 TaxID=1282360 RepID=UPI0012DDBE2E|nr:hypothetical protein [Asticcacaulis sp. AC460]